MIEKIGNVTLNLDFYFGEDLYSDGEIEDEILAKLTDNGDVQSIIAEDRRWPVLYHLSPIRQNIIEWYPIKETDRILEIGSGCGAITGALCRAAEKVTCVELSKKRSKINAIRNSAYENLEIYVANLNNLKIDEKFDYILLIGVLEYARLYTPSSENPYTAFLMNMRKYLKPEGKIIVAIENRYGLKYWAGAREDHTGAFFDGIEGYTKNPQIATFSKPELIRVLVSAGLSQHTFYYPYPDYKMPQQIFSDANLPRMGDLMAEMQNYDNDRYKLFNEKSVYSGLIQNEMYSFFSNSFMVIAK